MKSAEGKSAPQARDKTADPTLAVRRKQVEAYLNLARIHQTLDRRAAALFEEQGLKGVTPAQSNVLLLLMHKTGRVTARWLARQLAISEVTVGRFIRALQQNGWIERRKDPDDGRAVLIEPTKKTLEAMPTFISVANGLLDQAFSGFSQAEIERISATAQRLRDNFE